MKYNEALKAYEKEQKIYRKTKQKTKQKKNGTPKPNPSSPSNRQRPVAPEAALQTAHRPKEPAGYKTYTKSFCSYHAAIGSGTSAILYAAIPWTAGGDGDYHLTLPDETGGFACQDGGFEPAHRTTAYTQVNELEAKEREPAETAKARYEF